MWSHYLSVVGLSGLSVSPPGGRPSYQHPTQWRAGKGTLENGLPPGYGDVLGYVTFFIIFLFFLQMYGNY